MTRSYRLPSHDPDQPYYIRWSPESAPRGEGWVNEPRDQNGVLMIGAHYKPVDIAQYALFEYENYFNGEPRARDRFLAQANYLKTAQRRDGGYPFVEPNAAYSAASGWLSGMAQGEAASVLTRAWTITNDVAYRYAAINALAPLRRDVSEGGASFLRDDDVFFEEVAVPNACHILNGHLFAAFGLWEACQFGLGDAELKSLQRRSLATLLRWLGRFDADGWSYYDLATNGSGKRHLAPLWYHQFHIAQLRVYEAMVSEAVLGEVAGRWEAALRDGRARRKVLSTGVNLLTRSVLRRMGLAGSITWHPMP